MITLHYSSHNRYMLSAKDARSFGLPTVGNEKCIMLGEVKAWLAFDGEWTVRAIDNPIVESADVHIGESVRAMELLKEIREEKRAMKAAGIKRRSCFNAGHSPESYAHNARLFQLETALERETKHP
jgi:hypothetical protein